MGTGMCMCPCTPFATLYTSRSLHVFHIDILNYARNDFFRVQLNFCYLVCFYCVGVVSVRLCSPSHFQSFVVVILFINLIRLPE